MSDLEWLRTVDAERQARDVERLRAARDQAARTGKEPFDFVMLLKFYDPSSELSVSMELPDPEAVVADLERKYYLDFPEVRTIAEFAEALTRNRSAM